MKKNNIKKIIASGIILSTLIGCSDFSKEPTSVERAVDCDFTMLLNFDPVTSSLYSDFNQHPGSLYLENVSGKVVDYISSPLGEESTSFLMMMANRQLPDIMKVNMEKAYVGGVEEAIGDGMLLDITPIVEEYAPNFMKMVDDNPYLRLSAYTDEGKIAYFGAGIVEEEMRGLAFYGPLINANYLEETGLDVPVTIQDWEEMLQKFQDIGVKKPLSFGASTDFSALYDTFASAFGVTAGSTYFQENGQVKYSPLEEGYYDFVVLLNKWYEKGWLDFEFYKVNHSEIEFDFGMGDIGATIGHGNFGQSYVEMSGNDLKFVPAPYPVWNVGDDISTRHYTKDFLTDPVFVYTLAENPEEIVAWMDYFYTEEGISFTNWGIEGETYTVSEDGSKEFTDKVLNSTSVAVTAEYIFQPVRTVIDFEYSKYFYTEIQQNAWDVWGQANYQNVMPDTMTYTLEEQKTIGLGLDRLPNYVNGKTIEFIIGMEPLTNYQNFLDTLVEYQALEYLEMTQNAYNRYLGRGK